MADEAEIRHGGEDHAGDAEGERPGEQSPLQGRAAFIKNWDWQFVTGLNQGSCDRGKALHGYNPQTQAESQKLWEARRTQNLTLGETLDFLLDCHRLAPFLFFNGNTFGEIARRITDVIFIEFPLSRRREAGSLAAHYVAGVLDRISLEQGLKSLAQLADFKIGDQVQTLKGSVRGKIVRLLKDGRVVLRLDGTRSDLIALPETLLIVKQEK